MMLKKYYLSKRNSCCKMNYAVYFPNKNPYNLPLLLYLHEIGERGEKIEDIEKCALPKYMNEFDIPYIVLAPQCTDNNFWDYHLRDIEEILNEIYKEYKYDNKRVCILGSSMGLLVHGIMQCQDRIYLKE